MANLEGEGPTSSAVAEAAGVDRMLIKRYFGGLDGLLERFAINHRLCWTADALTAGLGEGRGAMSRAGVLTLVLLRYLRVLAASPAVLSGLRAEIRAGGRLAELVSDQRQHEEKRLFGALGQILGAPLEPHELVGMKTYMSAICVELIRRRAEPGASATLGADDLARLEAAITLGAAAQFGSR